jgi:sulfoxide reductase catalytic subunit YedY
MPRYIKNPKYALPNDPITPRDLYASRRKFLKQVGAISAGAALAACMPSLENVAGDPTPLPSVGGETLTDYSAATGYINYYEFSFSKEGIDELAKDFVTKPWQVEVGGLVRNPQVFTIEDILARYEQEERIYRMRCVEGWSMVIPWIGFPLSKLLADVEPLPEAKYVGFETVYRPEDMPGQNNEMFPWPYLEGLRLDEAMHDLTLLSTGMYGEPLTPQNGAPIRLVVPWKYAFKNIKSIVKIRLVADEPVTMWNSIASNEYGFYANVNPAVDHPRWSQATERRIGETNRRPTLLFNGYDEVAPLYEGMDLQKEY